MNILTFSSLYPNVVMPRHGVFVENRLRQLVNTGQVNASVVAPVPWFPFSSHCFGEYARFASVPKYEIRYGIAIQHPRYFLLPKVSMNLAPALMTRGALKAIKPLMAGQKNIQLIDAHYFYPDGVAAANIAELMNKPFVITARGTDINFIPRYKKPREMILSAAHKASPHLRLLQKKLAGEIMKMVHSAEDLDQAIEASEILFGKGTTETLKKLNEKTLLSVLEGVPQFLQERDVLNGGVNIADLLGEKTAVFASIPPPA